MIPAFLMPSTDKDKVFERKYGGEVSSATALTQSTYKGEKLIFLDNEPTAITQMEGHRPRRPNYHIYLGRCGQRPSILFPAQKCKTEKA